jgi:hypothetical protein
MATLPGMMHFVGIAGAYFGEIIFQKEKGRHARQRPFT